MTDRRRRSPSPLRRFVRRRTAHSVATSRAASAKLAAHGHGLAPRSRFFSASSSDDDDDGPSRSAAFDDDGDDMDLSDGPQRGFVLRGWCIRGPVALRDVARVWERFGAKARLGARPWHAHRPPGCDDALLPLAWLRLRFPLAGQNLPVELPITLEVVVGAEGRMQWSVALDDLAAASFEYPDDEESFSPLRARLSFGWSTPGRPATFSATQVSTVSVGTPTVATTSPFAIGDYDSSAGRFGLPIPLPEPIASPTQTPRQAPAQPSQSPTDDHSSFLMPDPEADRPPATAGFATGRGRPLPRPSEAAMERARRVMDRPPPSRGFETARGRAVPPPSPAAVARATGNFVGLPPPTPGFTTGSGQKVQAPSTQALAVAKSVLERSLPTPAPVGGLSGFTTGGGRAVAPPSAEAMARARAVFAGHERPKPAANKLGGNATTPFKTPRTASRPVGLPPTPASTARPPASSGFTTGSGKMVDAPSAESLARARVVIYGPDEDMPPPQTPTTGGFSTGTGRAVPPPSAAAKARAHALLNGPPSTPVPSSASSGFSTGSGKKVAPPSAEAMARARAVFGSVNSRTPAQVDPLQAADASSATPFVPRKMPTLPQKRGRQRPFVSPKPVKRRNMTPASPQTPHAPVRQFQPLSPGVPPSTPRTPLSQALTPRAEVGSQTAPRRGDNVTPGSARDFMFPPCASSPHWRGQVHALEALLAAGGDSRYATPEWAANHYGWIVWKLIGHDRNYHGGPPLAFGEVVRQLCQRYDREIGHAQRSCLRLIYERDELPGRHMVLCVSSLHPLELTDGWYKMRASADDGLMTMVRDGRIFVGQKLRIFGAELHNNDAPACSPLEPGADRIMLKIHRNGTRRALWHRKLGFQPTVTFLVNLTSLRDGGGVIPAIRAKIVKVFPMLVHDNANRITRTMREHELFLDQAASGFRDQCEREVAFIMNLLERGTQGVSQAAKDAVDMRRLASEARKTTDLRAWVERLDMTSRAALSDDESGLRERVAEDMREKHRQAMRSSPRLRVLLRDECPGRQATTVSLTVWRPSEDLVNEILCLGNVIEATALTIKRGALSTNNMTRYRIISKPAADAPSPIEPFASLAAMGRKIGAKLADVVAVVVCSTVAEATTIVRQGRPCLAYHVFLADDTGATMAVSIVEPSALPPVGRKFASGTVVFVENIDVTRVDEFGVIQACSTDETVFTAVTRRTRQKGILERAEALKAWAETEGTLRTVANSIGDIVTGEVVIAEAPLLSADEVFSAGGASMTMVGRVLLDRARDGSPVLLATGAYTLLTGHRVSAGVSRQLAGSSLRKAEQRYFICPFDDGKQRIWCAFSPTVLAALDSLRTAVDVDGDSDLLMTYRDQLLRLMPDDSDPVLSAVFHGTGVPRDLAEPTDEDIEAAKATRGESAAVRLQSICRIRYMHNILSRMAMVPAVEALRALPPQPASVAPATPRILLYTSDEWRAIAGAIAQHLAKLDVELELRQSGAVWLVDRVHVPDPASRAEALLTKLA